MSTTPGSQQVEETLALLSSIRRAPQQRNMRPGESYLAWNHRNVFKAPARTLDA